MANERAGRRRTSIHPVHAVLLASALPLFLGALLGDWAYSVTREVQWINFAAWLITGALPFAGFALVWAVVDLSRSGIRENRLGLSYPLTLFAAFAVGLLDALIHARDAWATMPAGLTLSLAATLMALASVALGFSTFRSGETR